MDADPHREPSDPWYADGLRFECTSCGACCTGPPGAVLFTEDEAGAMAAQLGITPDQFMADYTHDTPAGRSLRETETEHGQDCIFLDREAVPGKAICRVYEARPRQCRTFPYWDDNLRSPRAWQQAASRCEGIGRGAVVTLAEIRIERQR